MRGPEGGPEGGPERGPEGGPGFVYTHWLVLQTKVTSFKFYIHTYFDE